MVLLADLRFRAAAVERVTVIFGEGNIHRVLKVRMNKAYKSKSNAKVNDGSTRDVRRGLTRERTPAIWRGVATDIRTQRHVYAVKKTTESKKERGEICRLIAKCARSRL